MSSIKQRSCDSFWRLQDFGTTGVALHPDYGSARAVFSVRYFLVRVFCKLVQIENPSFQ